MCESANNLRDKPCNITRNVGVQKNSKTSGEASSIRAENIFPKYLLYYFNEIDRKYPREKKLSFSFYDSVQQRLDILRSANRWPCCISDLIYSANSKLESQTKRLNTQRDGPARLLPGLAEADLICQWIGMVEYILCYGGPEEHWGPLPATRLASRKILIEQNIKKRTGPAL